jgi:hypothetical protein
MDGARGQTGAGPWAAPEDGRSSASAACFARFLSGNMVVSVLFFLLFFVLVKY